MFQSDRYDRAGNMTTSCEKKKTLAKCFNKIPATPIKNLLQSENTLRISHNQRQTSKQKTNTDLIQFRQIKGISRT